MDDSYIEEALDIIKSWRRTPSKEEQLESFHRFKKFIPEQQKNNWREKYGEEGFEYLCMLNFEAINGHISGAAVGRFVDKFMNKEKDQH